MYHAAALQRIHERSAVVAIVGLGYVGLPLADAFVASGFVTIGFDVDKDRIAQLQEGSTDTRGPARGARGRLSGSAVFTATSDTSRLSDADAILVAVPTPLGAHDEPDLQFVIQSAQAIGQSLRPGQLVVLESTTFPSTTRTVFLDSLIAAHDSFTHDDLGTSFFVAYSPEREDPGRDIRSTAVPKVVGGLDDRSNELAVALYDQVFDHVFPVSSAEVAEASKLLENVFRAVNIALVNEMKIVLSALDVDVWEVIEAASTKPYGFMPFYPGPGLGGHCIPIDPFYLTWVAKEAGVTSNFIELAGITNTQMPDYVIQKVSEALNDDERSIRGSQILVLGLAYKRDVADMRESPACRLIERLDGLGAQVSYHDPFVPHYANPVLRTGELTSVPFEQHVIESADAVLIATDHTDIDYELLAQHARIVVDTRNVMHRRGVELTGRLYKA